jgi:hypothetical protein
MHMRLDDVVVNETTNFQYLEHNDLLHTFTVSDDYMDDEMVIPFDMHGGVSCLTSRKPAHMEFDTHERYVLTF